MSIILPITYAFLIKVGLKKFGQVIHKNKVAKSKLSMMILCNFELCNCLTQECEFLLVEFKSYTEF